MRNASELTYARPGDRLVRRLAIRSIEELSGRRRLLHLYLAWQSRVAAAGRERDGQGPCGAVGHAFNDMLALMRIELLCRGALPDTASLPDRLVMVANHPFGIGDGVAILALAERLGRPFRILVNNDLMKIPEMSAYGLPVSFEETRGALALNMATRRQAIEHLRAGTTIVVFPAGGVATAARVFGPAEDLPWKQFTARLIQQGGAAVLPIHFDGQNGPLFHWASRWSTALRVGLLIGEFRKLYGRPVSLTIGPVMAPEDLAAVGDRRALTARLRKAVFALSPPSMPMRTRRAA